MESKSINVDVLESAPDFVKVKLPFLEIPVKMNRDFFNSRLQIGYFQLSEEYPRRKTA